MKIYAILLWVFLLISPYALAQNQTENKSSHPDTVYVTQSGTVWHSTKNCSYLSRSTTVRAVPYESAKSLKPCSRCGGGVSNQTNTSTNVSAQSSTSTQQSSVETYNGHRVFTGPRGGKYYINSSGNKVYIKK